MDTVNNNDLYNVNNNSGIVPIEYKYTYRNTSVRIAGYIMILIGLLLIFNAFIDDGDYVCTQRNNYD